ncbi:MAG: helix-turn-helix domain-containing protein [Streptosporangiales bacterium]|nr:helix-turn-helix domain-containing protein [Streptosporangiales bacterium]MBO0889475.1 helix-turn-helix domain-containing protein [Acidothermales bacterium]
MNDDAFGATIAKRKLARRLRELREANGYTANQVCDKLDWGRGKVGRFESNGWIRPDMSDVRDLLRLYEKSDQEAQELERLAVLARERPWWRAYADVFDNEFPGYEGDADRIRVFVPLVVPGLLQTRAFVRAYMRAGSRTDEWRETAAEARLKRQDILDREENAPKLVAVITEASLMHQWGSAAERREQILHLVDMGQRPNIDLRMLRFEDGMPAGAAGVVNIFDFPGDEPTLVFAETEFTIREVTDTVLAKAHIDTFELIHERAASPSATVAQLRKLAKQLE